jgi:hypothetical protein
VPRAVWARTSKALGKLVLSLICTLRTPSELGSTTSNGDRAVHFSSKLHDAPRAGYYTPYSVAPGIDTVAVPDFDIDLLGHSYFAQAKALLHDI